MKSWFARAGLAISLGLALGAMSAFAHGAPIVKVDPAIVAAGGSITVTGTEMEVDVEFAITLDHAGAEVALGTVTAMKTDPAAEDGGFTQMFTIPATAKPGSYQVHATSKDGDTASADLTVTEASAAASTGPAEEKMASGELHALDRSKPAVELIGLGAIAALTIVVGLWLARPARA